MAVEPFTYIDEVLEARKALRGVRTRLKELEDAGVPQVIAVDLEGELSADGSLSLLQLKVEGLPAIVFDMLGPDGAESMMFDTSLAGLLCHVNVCKVMHDCRRDVVALFGQLGVRVENVYDTQVAHMLATGTSVRPGLNEILMTYCQRKNVHKDEINHGNEWSERPLSRLLLSYAAQDVEHLVLAYKNMSSNPAMSNETVTKRCVDVRNRALDGVAEGCPRPQCELYNEMDPRAQCRRTAFAFYVECIINDVRTRERCQDRAMFNLSFRQWKAKACVPDNAVGTRYKGAVSQIIYQLMYGGKIINLPRGPGRDPNIITWAMECAGGGTQAADRARQSASATVRKQRELFEGDRLGISVGKIQFPDVVASGQELRYTFSVSNNGPTPRVLKAAKFLRSIGSSQPPTFSTSLSAVQLPKRLEIGEIFTIELRCVPTFGMTRDILELDFHDFSIGRFLEVQAGDRELHDALKPSQPYARRKRPRRRDDREATTEGTRPGGGVPWMRHTQDHKLPPKLRDRKHIKEIEDALKEWHELMVLDPDGAPSDLDTDYHQFYKSLLFVEELQLRADLHEFDMDNTRLSPKGRFYSLEVPGLAENRPSVLRGDKLVARVGEEATHIGFAFAVERDTVTISFHHAFSYLPGQAVDIEFSLNRTHLRVQHEALRFAGRLGSDILFPALGGALRAPRPEIPEEFTEIRRGLNPEQRQAVLHILEARARPVPYVVFGPPGTGKTRTMVETIAQVVKLLPKSFRVLACAPSNTAVDVLCLGLSPYVQKREMLRVVAASRTKDNVLKEVHPFCLDTDDDSHFRLPESKDELSSRRVVVTTLSMASRLPFMLDLEPGFFDMIVIDEAGQAPEPEAVAVVANLLDPRSGQLVLAGDPRQLGPIIHSDVAKWYGLDISLLERITKRTVYQKHDHEGAIQYDPNVLTKLVRNYRSHESILETPSELFYDGELIPCADKEFRNAHVGWEHLPNTKVPIVFHGVAGADAREANSPSWFNVHEVEVVRDYVRHLLESRTHYIKTSDIGIIAPYQKQVQKIRSMLANHSFIDIPGRDLREIMVGSAEQFQGQEKRVIIISTTRSSKEYLNFDAKHALGFLTNPKRFNVAVTRAMSLLIVIGHPDVLVGCPNWRALLTYSHTRGAIRGEPIPASALSSEAEGSPGGADGPSPSVIRDELTESIARMAVQEVDIDDSEGGSAPSNHIQQTAVGFVREE